jgi:RNA polymerase sigma-70 factor (ECF subfamily)
MDRQDADPLTAGLVAGDEQAYAALYDRFAVRLYRTALGIVRSRQDAEDAVQEVFLGVLKSRQRLRDVQDLTAYLFTALRRAAARIAARRAKGPAVSQLAVAEVIDADASNDRPVLCRERLEKALLALPAEQQEVLLLKIDGELTFVQIAEVVGVSMNTAASRYRYALEKLRKDLESPE